MKKILFFIESLAGGGAEKVLTDLVSNLDVNKYEITVCSIVGGGVYSDFLKERCKYKTLISNPEGRGWGGKVLYAIKYKLIKGLPSKIVYPLFFKIKYDVEVAFIEGFSTKLISGSNNINSKKIAWVHIDLYQNHWTRIEYRNIYEEIKVYRKFDNIICVANSVKDAFVKRFGLSEKILVKYNPVNKENILLSSKEESEKLKTKKLKLVTVGRLEYQKGYDRLLEVVCKIKKEGFDFKLWIVGEGSMRGALEEYIEQEELSETVFLEGFQKNPYKYIKASDVFVCSSRNEGYSTVVTEALIIGKPIVSTDCSGMTELLGESEYGLIVNNSKDDLYNGLKLIMTDKSLREQYGEKSKERGKDFELDTIIDKIQTLF